ncbi:MAG: hypothetical protein ACP5OZ_03375 [Candidatus Woesearchaeota archaeon]
MEDLELRIMEIWNRNMEKVAGIAKNKNNLLAEFEKSKRSALTAGEINRYIKIRNEIKETINAIEELAEIKESTRIIPSFETDYNLLKDLKEKAEEARRHMLNKIKENFYRCNEELNKNLKTQKFKEAKELRKKMNLNAGFYRALLKLNDAEAKEKRKSIFKRESRAETKAENFLMNYCNNLKEYYAIPRKIREISKDYLSVNWDENSINVLREIYDGNFVSRWGIEDLLSKIIRLNFMEFFPEAERLKKEIWFFLQKHSDIVRLKTELLSKQEQMKKSIQEISEFSEPNEQKIINLIEGKKTIVWEAQKEFYFLDYLKDEVQKYGELRVLLDSKINAKINEFKLRIEDELAKIKSYKLSFQSIEADDKELSEKISQFRNLERIAYIIKSNFGTDIKGLKEANKELNDYLNKIMTAKQRIMEISKEMEKIKICFEELLKSKEKTEIIKFENELDIKEQEYKRLRNEPYFISASGQALEHISSIRHSVQKLKSFIENEDKNKSNKSELEALIKEFRRNSSVNKNENVSRVLINPYLYFSSLGPTPNPDLFSIREELLNFSIKNIDETVEKVYNLIKNMKELRLHSDCNYFNRMVEGYKTLLNSYASRIVLDENTKEKFSKTLSLINQILERARNAIE